MSDTHSEKPPRPPARGRRWTSFGAPDAAAGRAVRRLEEQANPTHRVRVEHDTFTLLIHLSDEDGGGWTTFAVDRGTRAWAVAQASAQRDAASEAYDQLYDAANGT